MEKEKCSMCFALKDPSEIGTRVDLGFDIQRVCKNCLKRFRGLP
jgi:hypothetical protein